MEKGTDRCGSEEKLRRVSGGSDGSIQPHPNDEKRKNLHLPTRMTKTSRRSKRDKRRCPLREETGSVARMDSLGVGDPRNLNPSNGSEERCHGICMSLNCMQKCSISRYSERKDPTTHTDDRKPRGRKIMFQKTAVSSTMLSKVDGWQVKFTMNMYNIYLNSAANS